jgi:hypothetical protein
MNSLENKQFTICTHCNKRKLINYSSQPCRRKFLLSSSQIKDRSIPQISNQKNFFTENELISGNSKLDEFIKETQKSEFCDDFVEWVSHKNLVNINYLTSGGNSKIFCGTWNVPLNTNIVLKAIDFNDNSNDYIPHEVKRLQGIKYRFGTIYFFNSVVFQSLV